MGNRQGHAGLARTDRDRQRQPVTGRGRQGQEATGRSRYEQVRIGMKGQAGSDGNVQGWRDRQRQVVTVAGPEGKDRYTQRQAGTVRERQGRPPFYR